MEPEKKSNGSIVGLVIIIIILIIGGIYIWQSNKNTIEETEIESENMTEDAILLDSLEAEIQATDTDTGVDANAVY